MNYFDIFRIDYDDLKIISENPEAVMTAVEKTGAGYVGQIKLVEEHPERETNILFFHENEFPSVQEAYADLDRIIETIQVAFKNTRHSEAIGRTGFSE